jgi:hypothetical protein
VAPTLHLILENRSISLKMDLDSWEDMYLTPEDHRALDDAKSCPASTTRCAFFPACNLIPLVEGCGYLPTVGTCLCCRMDRLIEAPEVSKPAHQLPEIK